MGRIEYKYLVPVVELTNLRNAILPYVEPDGFMQSDVNEYVVHSIYYDTASFAFYHEKSAGVQYRTKVRIRSYNEGHDDSHIFLELKRKDDATVWKNRAPVLYRNLAALFETKDIGRFVLNGNGNPRSHEDAGRFFFQIYRHSLLPVIGIHYNREAYFYKFDRSVRITFDKRLRSTLDSDIVNLFDDASSVPTNPEHFILEVKYNDTVRGMPVWLQDILGRFRMRRSALSKYCMCLEEHAVPGRTPACGMFSPIPYGTSMKGS